MQQSSKNSLLFEACIHPPKLYFESIKDGYSTDQSGLQCLYQTAGGGGGGRRGGK